MKRRHTKNPVIRSIAVDESSGNDGAGPQIFLLAVHNRRSEEVNILDQSKSTSGR